MTASAMSQAGERDRATVKFGEIDWVLFTVLCLIGAAGIAMLYSIAGLNWQPWALKQVLRFVVGVVLMLVLALISLRVWSFVAYPLYGLAVLLLVAVKVHGETTMGAERWLHLGPLRLQPSEIMKIALVLALARFYQTITAKEANLSWKLAIPAAMTLLPFVLVVTQPDLGTAILLLLTGGAVMMVAGLNLKVIAAGIVSAAIPPIALIVMGATEREKVMAVVLFFLKPYQRDRVLTFFDSSSDPSSTGYQIIQSKIAMGSGGLLGRGYGLGSQSHLSFIPEKQTDFIFATFAEEFGFVGCISLLFLFALAIFISLRIAAVSHSHFGRLAASGVTATFAFYVLINAAMVMGLAPVVGTPMPMLSYGGTIMLTTMVGFGLVQAVRVHRYDEVGSGKGSIF